MSSLKSSIWCVGMSLVALLMTGAVLAGAGGAGDDASPGAALDAVQPPQNPRLVGNPAGVSRISLDKVAWVNPGVNMAKVRDIDAARIYAKVAPAVVVVKKGSSYGTGFIIDADGWIITNNHVIAGAPIDPQTGQQVVEVFVGHLDGDWMKLVAKPMKAVIYKASKDKDLALLKIENPPKGADALPVVKLANELPKPGSDCIAIGHPAAGALWSVRPGQLTGMGEWPAQMADVAVELLSLDKDAEGRAKEQLAHLPKLTVLFSNCGINSGDSGGPLLNKAGELIGVTFAMPTNNEDRGRQGTTSYHICLDELRNFIKDRPAQPLLATDPWPDSPLAALASLQGTQQPDALVFVASGPQRQWTAMLIDLLQSNPRNLDVDHLIDPANRGQWKFQIAIHRGATARAFYDTAGTGHIDLILLGPGLDSVATVALQLKDGQWTSVSPEGRRVIDPRNFTNADLQKKFVSMLQHMGGK